MEDDRSTVNGGDSVLNSSFNSALSGFESLLRKQMGDDPPSRTSGSSDQIHPEQYNEQMKDRVSIDKYGDLDYHGAELERQKYIEASFANGTNSAPPRSWDKYSATNGDRNSTEQNGSRYGRPNVDRTDYEPSHNRDGYSDMDFKAMNPRSPPKAGMDFVDGSSRTGPVNHEQLSQQSSLTSEQELSKYFADRKSNEHVIDAGKRSLDRLAHSLRKTVDKIGGGTFERSQSDEKLSDSGHGSAGSYQNNTHNNYTENPEGAIRRSSADIVNSRYPVDEHGEPIPRGRSGSPYRVNLMNKFRDMDSRKDENMAYREMDPRFRNRSPEHGSSMRDRSVSPYREDRVRFTEQNRGRERESYSYHNSHPSSPSSQQRSSHPASPIPHDRGSGSQHPPSPIPYDRSSHPSSPVPHPRSSPHPPSPSHHHREDIDRHHPPVDSSTPLQHPMLRTPLITSRTTPVTSAAPRHNNRGPLTPENTSSQVHIISFAFLYTKNMEICMCTTLPILVNYLYFTARLEIIPLYTSS